MSLSLRPSWHRSVALAVVAALCAGVLLLTGPRAGATSAAAQDRLAGQNRYETAALIAEAAYPNGADVAVVASGLAYPDALAGAALAGLQDAPLLLTDPNALSPETAAELDNLGVTTVYILGGTTAVTQAVQDDLAQSFAVTRLAGNDRYDTAAKIATAVGSANVGTVGGLKTAIVATGLDFADALAGGPLAAAGPASGVLPILLVNTDVPASTNAAIGALGIKQVIVLGGTSAVSTTVEAKLVAATGNPVVRYAGQTRWDTATKIADAEKSVFGFPMSSALLANGFGTHFPDALAGGPLAGLLGAPILLTDVSTLPTETSSWLTANRSTVADVVALGGTAAIGQSVLDAAQTAATSPPPSRVNETLAVSPTSTVTLTNGAKRDYTVTGLGTTAIDIALESCSNVSSTSGGNTQFANTNTNTIADGTLSGGTAPDGASTTSSITAVNGAPTPTNDDYANNVAPSSGTVTFTITGPSGANSAPSCVQPVVFVDANADNALNSATTNPAAPTESFGTGGQTNFVPADAAAGPFNAVGVTSYTAGASQFSGCTYVREGVTGNVNTNSCFTYTFDAGDSFQLDPNTPITMAEFQSRLSDDDQVKGTYAPGAQSTFVLTDDSPMPPINVAASRAANDAGSVTVTWSANPANGSADVRGYRVYRAEASTCPPITSGAYAPISGVWPASPFVDSDATAGSDLCYSVTSVADTDESTLATPVAVSSLPVFASASLSTSHQTITLTYNHAVQCPTVDANASDYVVKSGTSTVTPLAATCVGATSATVTLTFTPALTAAQVAVDITVTAKAGGDADTVKDAANGAQPVDDQITVGDVPRFVSASTTADSITLTLTYTEPIACTSVQPDDFTIHVVPPTGGGTPFDVSPLIYSATCVSPTNGASTKIALTFTNGTSKYQSGQQLTVTAKNGVSDTDTVLDADESRPQKVGDSTSTTVS